jgi:hypothetical protein
MHHSDLDPECFAPAPEDIDSCIVDGRVPDGGPCRACRDCRARAYAASCPDVSNDNDRADDNCHGCGQFRAFAFGLCSRCVEADFNAYCERNPDHE